MKKSNISKKIFEKTVGSIYRGSKEEVFSLMKSSDFDINMQDKDGNTLLLYAVLDGKSDIAKLLIENGADCNIGDKSNWTPLHHAAQNFNIELANILLESNANVNAKDEYGNTVLWRAAFASQGKGEMIKLLLAFGADPNIKNESGISPLDLANTIGNYDVKQFFE